MPEPGDTPEPQNPEPTPDPSDAGKAPDWEQEAQKWKSQARKHEGRARENADKAKRFDELEQANKTDIEKATGAQRAAEERAATAERDALKWRVGLKKGLTEAQAKRLVGGTEEELEADADELIASFGPSDRNRMDPGGRPKEALRSGARPNDEPETDVREVVKAIPRGI